MDANEKQKLIEAILEKAIKEAPIAIFNYQNACDTLPQEIVDLVAQANPEWNAKEDRESRWTAARYIKCHLAQREARKMGLTIHPGEAFLHDSFALIEEAQGMEAGEALAKKYGFTAREPQSMWDEQAGRRSGDGVLLFISDDRGWSSNWMFWIAVAWAPEKLEQEIGWSPELSGVAGQFPEGETVYL